MGLPPTRLPPVSTLAAAQVSNIPLDDTTITVLGVAAIIVLVGLSAFSSSSEIAMFSLAKHRVDSMVEEGTPDAERVKSLKDDPHRLLVTILVGNNIVNTAMSSLATGLFAVLDFGTGESALISTFGITALILLFGESTPKSCVVENTESWPLRIVHSLKYAELLLLPLVVLFGHLTRLVNRVTDGQTAIEMTYTTRDKIQNLIETSECEGVIEEEEREMLDRTFRFNSTIAKEVMTSRLDMTIVPKDATIDEAIETCVQADHGHVPVHNGNLDNIIGIVNIRNLVREKYYGERGVGTADIVSPTLHVPESGNVDELVAEIQGTRMRMVIVIDEFGTTEGLVTLEDMIEEIVDDILEGDEGEPFESVDENTYLVRGEVNIDEVNEILDIELPEGEEFETLAGFIFNRTGRLVEGGEEISYNDIVIRIEQVDNTRIMKARIRTNTGIEATDGNGDGNNEENGGDEEAEVEPDT